MADDRVPVRVYATNAAVAVGLNWLISLALGHATSWVWNVLLSGFVGVVLTWSYLRRQNRANRTARL